MQEHLPYFVGRVYPSSELRAREEINRLKLEGKFEGNCYVPTEPKTVSHARKIEVKEAPLIQGYIFLTFDPDYKKSNWNNILHCYSICNLLGPKLNPTPIRGDFIERIRTESIALHAAAMADKSIHLEPLQKGTRVIITEGPYASKGGIVDLSHGDRVKLMLDALVRVKVDLPRSHVKLVA